MLKFQGSWRIEPPENGDFHNKNIPTEAINDFVNIIMKISSQGNRQDIIEHFKGYFCNAAGTTHVRSSSESWAETDLYNFMHQSASNAPLFIEAIYDASRSLQDNYPEFVTIDVEMLNKYLIKHNIGYEVVPPNLIMRAKHQSMIEDVDPPSTLEDNAMDLFEKSLRRSEELLLEARGREAVQEILWLLESVATAFRGMETNTQIIEGKYFNRIAKELKRANHGTSFERVISWLESLHGYLSSPTGGGVRHGLDLNSGKPMEQHEARLYCNLVRSYLYFILSEHQRLSENQ